MSQPWMKFYPRDWRGDQALRAVSIGARGFWMECICIMHEAKPYGHLTLNGAAIPMTVLARMTGTAFEEAESLLGELRAAGVFSTTRAGIIVSRRMIADFARAEKGRKAVEKRYGEAAETIEENNSPNRSPITQKPETRIQKPKKKKEGSAAVGDAIASSGGAPSLPVVAVVVTELDQAIRIYNDGAALCPGALGAGWAVCTRTLTANREKAMRARLKEVGLDGWRAAVTRATRSDFLSGRAKRGVGHENWGVDIGWLAKAENFAKLSEGKYDNGRGRAQPRGQDSARAGLMDFLNDGPPDEEICR